MWQESDWEEIQGGVAESNDSLLSSAAAPFGRTTYGQLEAMAKAYNEVNWWNFSCSFVVFSPHHVILYFLLSDEKFPILSLYFPHIMLFYICFSLLLLQYWPNFCDIQEWRGLGWWWSIECFRSAQWGNFQHYPFFFLGGGEFSIFFLRVLWIFEVSHTALISWNIPSRLTW